MKKFNRYQIFNIIILVLAIILSIVELVKIYIWSTHRHLEIGDFSLISGCFTWLILFVTWFIFATRFEHSGKFRKTSFSLLVCSVFCAVIRIYQKAIAFKSLFFESEIYSPPFIDRFTSLFELILILVLAVLLVVYFVCCLIKKHFKRLS